MVDTLFGVACSTASLLVIWALLRTNSKSQ
jgi:hypothetical protein